MLIAAHSYIHEHGLSTTNLPYFQAEVKYKSAGDGKIDAGEHFREVTKMVETGMVACRSMEDEFLERHESVCFSADDQLEVPAFRFEYAFLLQLREFYGHGGAVHA